MSSGLFAAIEEILPRVQTPSRYMGHELHALSKDWDSAKVRFALAYPDLYEVGMSHLGMQILYRVLSESPDTLAERVFAPAHDMEKLLHDRGIPLFSLESRRGVGDFDMVGITLQYEMTYTNIVNMLSMSGIPLRSENRTSRDPFVIGGGPCAFNVEPLAPYFDLVCLGDGEEVLPSLIGLFQQWKADGCPEGREGFLHRAASLRGVYVPAFFRPLYGRNDELVCIESVMEEQGEVTRTCTDLRETSFPVRPIVPYAETVHDRASVEIFRGCTQGCRFCLAGMVYRPVRERSPDQVVDLCLETIANTGYSEVSLSSLSSTNHSGIGDIMHRLKGEFSDSRVSVSLPSLRIDDFSVQIAEAVKEVRDTGITLAPEAGTQRMRDVINKRVSEEDYVRALRAAFSAGCDTIKLYFMLGLPTETDEDVRGIAEMVRLAQDIYDQRPGTERPLQVNLSVACFIPKPHTPFQWEPQLSVDEFRRRVDLLRAELPRGRVKFSWHEPEMSFLEGALARGDRRLADVIEAAWRKGCRFDGWTEYFQPEKWYEAFAECGLDPRDYVTRRRKENEVFPWMHLRSGVSDEFLWREQVRAHSGVTTPDCRRGECSDCGVCPELQPHRETSGHHRSEGGHE